MRLYKNISARNHLGIFFISAVTSLLLVRLFLHVTGYPQLGGDGLHIAHMLWGGLLMLVSHIILLSFLGKGPQLIAAIIGGSGFGVFIDEIGKFITSDNDYFYRPAIGIIYAIFVILYLLIDAITKNSRLSSKEYQLNALAELEEALAHDMDASEKERTQALLSQADQQSPITRALQDLLNTIEAIPQPPQSNLSQLFGKLDSFYQKFWQQRKSSSYVKTFFIVEAVLLFLAVLATFITDIDELVDLLNGRIDYGMWLLIGELISALVASLIAINGALTLRKSRLDAFILFQRATLINLLLTEFFAFSRIQFLALPGFILNLLLIIFISYAIAKERQARQEV